MMSFGVLRKVAPRTAFISPHRFTLHLFVSCLPSTHIRKHTYIMPRARCRSRDAQPPKGAQRTQHRALQRTERGSALHRCGQGDRAIVITGSEKAFAAGADIKEMKDKSFSDVYQNKFLESWQDITKIRKPIIAAVSGYALGGGCELALMADILLASPSAKFGQPEVNIGTITGGGGSQRLARAVGKSRAMELTLTGRMWNAQEAVAWGMASRVVGEGEGAVVREAIELAVEIAAKSQVAVQAQKEAVNAAFEQGLSEGLRTERRLFHMTFATADQKEGMAAFAEKRKPEFTNS
ncbi:ClpP/crotonase-like domain-containing protein [Lactifluus volemus]|nr:ClpP/crotonase-like domain-containing protein [Lactifluus volemus]